MGLRLYPSEASRTPVMNVGLRPRTAPRSCWRSLWGAEAALQWEQGSPRRGAQSKHGPPNSTRDLKTSFSVIACPFPISPLTSAKHKADGREPLSFSPKVERRRARRTPRTDASLTLLSSRRPHAAAGGRASAPPRPLASAGRPRPRRASRLSPGLTQTAFDRWLPPLRGPVPYPACV